ncbi:MAG TPA: phosphoribosylanthranilate isomerase [Anaerolineaceae bacterium]|jgi:phosphoribosylanthranilate isomerase
MKIQVYAFTQIDQALEAAALGVDQIGFIAGDYGLVPAELSYIRAAQLARALEGKATRVALTMSTDVEEILRMDAAVQPDVIHISTDPLDVGVEAMRELRRRLPEGRRLMKAIPVDGEETPRLAAAFAGVADLILLDTKVQGMPGVGATGRTNDWEISRRVIQAARVPVILAGGLSAENVAAAIHATHPWGVDSNTHTNRLGDPAAKDLQRVRRFVDAIRQTECDLHSEACA